ncbi:hypothetical protein IQ254_11765 [Nodosilinea sp. LEGE 07088]|uniref:hypothetical protein n=1 Tax=Nodosilinea sp. LEGE 07088 TaxID=2777968 RepID=UPI00187E28C2|nr:hypothetical protein [Nodosilinea sp. LEGE 07088]MBE9137861.1 hypothetical protein [Nodosilinea sp. LEGE 07088]
MPNSRVLDTAIAYSQTPIRITYQQWAHVVENHDYMAGCLEFVLETLSEPNFIVDGWETELIALRAYPKTPISKKSVVVVFKEAELEGFMITAFMTSKPGKILRRGILWQR